MPQQQDWFAANAPAQIEPDWFAQDVAPVVGIATPEPEQKSLGGFARNVVTSGANVVKGAVSMLNPANWDDMAHGMAEGQRESRRRLIAGEAQDAPLARRYGSVEKATDTLYSDPVG